MGEVSERVERLLVGLREWGECRGVVNEVEGVEVWSDEERLRWFEVWGVGRVRESLSEVEGVLSELSEVLSEGCGENGLRVSGEVEGRVLVELRGLRWSVMDCSVRVERLLRGWVL